MSCSVKGTDSARIELTASATQLCVGSTGEILARLELADGSNEEGSFTFNSDSECLNFLGNNSKNGKFEVTTKGLATLSDGKLDPAQFPLDVNITVTHGKLSECLVITIVGVEKYNLVLNSNYDVDYEDITIDYGENLTLPECSRQGYNFLGWYLPDNSLLEGGIVGDLGDYPNGIYDAENPITVNVNALWEIETYKLVFNANGGRSCKDITLNYGDTLTLPETIREGYTFRGWYLSDNSLLKGGTAGDLGDYPNGIYDAENPITVDVTALWEIETYNLVFNTDGGSDCEDITINYGDTLTLPETSRAGYVFIGWYLSPEFDSGSLLTNGEIADLGEAAEGILTVNVYASWEIETYKLVFYTVEGTACDDIIINYGEELTLPTTIKEGHIFRWWYLLNGSYNDDKLEDGTAGDLGDYPGGIYDAENPITVNVGAIWSKEQYQLVFNSNGGSDCEDIFKFYDNEITLPVPTKEGYVFMGWYLSPDFSSDSRLTDGKVGDLGDYPDGIYDIKNPIDVNVYASWEIETYKLVFNANGGSDCEEVTLNYGDTLTLP
ncbi:MAG: InlB B-repeat-containing protein, partial [Candidatus Coproplasma sp.]